MNNHVHGAPFSDTVDPPNNGHSGDRPLVHCREVVPISEFTECMLQSFWGKQFIRFMEVVRFSECPLSEVPLYVIQCRVYTCLEYRVLWVRVPPEAAHIF